MLSKVTNGTMQDIGLILIGCGIAGKMHARAFRELYPQAPLLCIGREGNPPDRFAKFYNGYVFSSLTEAFNSGKANVSVIATPPAFHIPYALDILDRGLCVLIEKPLAIHVDEARTLVQIAQGHSNSIAVGHVLRCVQVFQMLRDIIQTGQLGEITSWQELRFAFRPSLERNWWSNLPSGLLGFQGVHSLDLLNWIFGPGLKEHQLEYLHYSENIGWYDHFRLYAKHSFGFPIFLEHSFNYSKSLSPIYELTVKGTKRVARVTGFNQLELSGELIFQERSPLISAFQKQMENFLKSAFDPGYNPSCTVIEGIIVTEQIDKFLQVGKRACN